MPVDFFTSSKCATGAEISPVFHQRPANLFSAILNLATMGIVLVVYFPLLAAIRLRDYVAMSALLVARLAAGWLLGGPEVTTARLWRSQARCATSASAATANFGGTTAVTAVLAYGIFEIVGSLLLALACGRPNRSRRSCPSIWLALA